MSPQFYTSWLVMTGIKWVWDAVAILSVAGAMYAFVEWMLNLPTDIDYEDTDDPNEDDYY